MTVMTVLGPIDGSQLGRVDAHEHIFLRSPVLPGDEFQDLDKMATEVNAVHQSGIDTIVDLTPIGLGRLATKTAELSRQCGVNVVLATGVHRRAHYPAGHWLYKIDTDQLCDLIARDIIDGIDDRDWQGPEPVRTRVRAGIIKLGASYHSIHDSERRWIEAGAKAALQTGVPVAVHTEVGTAAHDILDALEDLGVPLDRVMLAHLDRNLDPELHAELAERGAYLGYDTIGRTKYHADRAILDLVENVAALGHADRVLFGTDVGRRTMLRAYGGGPGMDVLGRAFLPRLRARLGGHLEQLAMVDNPRRLLTRANPTAAPSS
jgi:predicted metal-dependent phosphotriesterase family hydrolase